MIISERGGRVLDGFRLVATIGAWRLERLGGGFFRIGFEPRAIDEFRWSQPDLRIELVYGTRRWTWPVRSLPAPSALVQVEVEGEPETKAA